APTAKIMPLRAFNANGQGYTSSILRAIYYATRKGGKVLNMSFSRPTSSPELKRALDYAVSNGLIAVSSAGNNGSASPVYPGAHHLRLRGPRLVGRAVMPAAAVLRQGAMPFSWARLQVRELEDRVRATRRATICALNQMLDLKDLNTGVHGTRLAEWAVRIGQDLGLDEGGLEDIEVAALLHDAGKVGVPDAILRKPGPLDPE